MNCYWLFLHCLVVTLKNNEKDSTGFIRVDNMGPKTATEMYGYIILGIIKKVQNEFAAC